MITMPRMWCERRLAARCGRVRVRLVATLLAAAILVGGCGERRADPGTDLDVAPPTETGSRPDMAGVLPADRGEPPDELVVEDLVVGDGELATPGDQLAVHYVGVDWATGATFDATWDRGVAFRFTLGAGRVIDGWELGLEGVRAGGRRLLVIPPEMAYGDRGSAGGIAPGATLVFVVDVVEVEAVPAESGAGT